MKRLTILRHGKAIRSDDFPIDYDRPLSKRGPQDLKRAVKVLANLSPPVDWIVSSPAKRAHQTASIVNEGLGLEKRVVWEEDIYSRGADALFLILLETPDEFDHVLVVGHNPTLEQIVSGLCAGSDCHMANSLPTSGLASIELDIARWEQLRWGCGELRLLLRPRLLKGF